MTEWSAERLDALPEGTVIAFTVNSYPVLVVKRGDGETYSDVDEGSFDTIGVLRCPDPGSLRVVSVPIDALLADETVHASAQYPEIQASRTLARVIICDAIAHVTGEAI